MIYLLEQAESIWGPMRLFGYVTMRCFLALVVSMGVGFVIAPKVIRKLKEFKLEQRFRDKEEVHKLAELHEGKAGTPTMGGVIIFISITAACLLCVKWNVFTLVAYGVYVAFTALGFYDDHLKVFEKNSRGLSSKKKLLAQLVVSLVAITALYKVGENAQYMRELWVPFYKAPVIHSMPWVMAAVLAFLVITGTSNAINLTDGVDGLAIGCTIPAAMVFAVMAYVTGNMFLSEYLHFRYLAGSEELTVLCAGVLGACIVFLWYNAHPAEVFMGDTGSLALGGLVGSIALMVHQPFTLVIVGGVYVMEAMSVIIQVISFQSTGKRVFRMSPIHHHFELGGWHENKVVIRFWILSLLFAIAGLSTLKLR